MILQKAKEKICRCLHPTSVLHSSFSSEVFDGTTMHQSLARERRRTHQEDTGNVAGAGRYAWPF